MHLNSTVSKVGWCATSTWSSTEACCLTSALTTPSIQACGRRLFPTSKSVAIRNSLWVSWRWGCLPSRSSRTRSLWGFCTWRSNSPWTKLVRFHVASGVLLQRTVSHNCFDRFLFKRLSYVLRSFSTMCPAIITSWMHLKPCGTRFWTKDMKIYQFCLSDHFVAISNPHFSLRPTLDSHPSGGDESVLKAV